MSKKKGKNNFGGKFPFGETGKIKVGNNKPLGGIRPRKKQ